MDLTFRLLLSYSCISDCTEHSHSSERASLHQSSFSIVFAECINDKTEAQVDDGCNPDAPLCTSEPSVYGDTCKSKYA